MIRNLVSLCLLALMVTIFATTFSFSQTKDDKDIPTVSPDELKSSTEPSKVRPIKALDEERVVRMIYKKVTLMHSAEFLRKFNHSGGKPTDGDVAGAISFTLTNFISGDISDISRQLWTDLVTPPNGYIISLSTVDSSETQDKVRSQARPSIIADWHNGLYSSAIDPKWTVEDALRIEAATFKDVTRYVSYQVTVQLDGRTRTYSALALFHERGKDKFTPQIFDSVCSMAGELDRIAADRRIPAGMKEVHQPKTAAVTDDSISLDAGAMDARYGDSSVSKLLGGGDGGCVEQIGVRLAIVQFCLVVY